MESNEKEPMKKTLLNKIPDGIPLEIRRFAAAADLYDSSSSPGASVYFIDKGNGYYVKRSGKGTLAKESKMTEFFHAKGFGAEVLSYISAADDWLFTAAVPGEDCTCEKYRGQPKRLCDTIAFALRKLHETDPAGCPVPDRMADYFAAAEQGYRAGKYDPSLFSGFSGSSGDFTFRSAEQAHDALLAGKDALQSRVLLHGDYCLPNIILRDWKLSGFIYVDNGGVGDRHIDLFWGAWTLCFNLKTDRYCGRFLDAYGRDRADEEILKTIAAAEVFG